MLQLPQPPPPPPRRQEARRRLDGHGRRLPPGPAPPPSWLNRSPGDAQLPMPVDMSRLRRTTLPGLHLPAPGSLVDLVLRQLARGWRYYQSPVGFDPYLLPSHLKPALIRTLGMLGPRGLGIVDLHQILIPAREMGGDGGHSGVTMGSVDSRVICLDLTGWLCQSLELKELSRLIFGSVSNTGQQEVEASWEVGPGSQVEAPMCSAISQLSLALDPAKPCGGSWRQLLDMSSKASCLTHLSLAYWPRPCLSRQPVKRCGGHNADEGSDSCSQFTDDGDWGETVFILRTLSQRLYKLEFLDLTGCSSWTEALALEVAHDGVDWVGSWGKVSHLRLGDGLRRAAYGPTGASADASARAARVERHIVAKRAGKGRFITVER